MKILTINLLITCLTVFLFSTTAQARDDRLQFPIEDLIKLAKDEGKISDDVKFFFGQQKYGKVEQKFGTFSSNKKTNAFNKSDKQACEWAALGALASLHDRAIREGGNAVVEIVSNYKKQEFTSETEYECGAGRIIAGAALRGKVVKLAD